VLSRTFCDGKLEFLPETELLMPQELVDCRLNRFAERLEATGDIGK
jgi:hypothetical protein